MSAETKCWECGTCLPEDELQEHEDGSLLCNDCHIKELEVESAEQETGERSTGQDRVPVELHLSLPPASTLDTSSAVSETWTSAY